MDKKEFLLIIDNMDLNSVSAMFSKIDDASVKDELMTLMQNYLHQVADQNVELSLRQKVGTSDIVQQSFLQVIEHFHQFRGDTTVEFKGWLKAIVINEINKARRSFFTAKRDVQREASIDDSSGNDVRVRDRGLTPSSQAVSAERIDTFHRVLAKMEPNDAMVIRLRSIEGLSFEEVGQRMERSKDNVSKLWYRAVIKFEGKLRAHMSDSNLSKG